MTSTSAAVGITMFVSMALGLGGCPEDSTSADGVEVFGTGDETAGQDSGGETSDQDTNADEDMPGNDEWVADGGELSEGGETGQPDGACGDFGVQDDEECDGWNTAFESCVTLGFAGGELGCHDDCTFDVSGCLESGCGNGLIEAPELCDDTPYPCWLLGYAGALDANGLTPCLADCTPDESACDPACEWGEPGCFCLATTPCPDGYLCTAHPLFPLDGPGTCEPDSCPVIGEACTLSPPRPACCPGSTCVDNICA